MNVVIVDDHPATRHALRALLPAWSADLEVVGEAATAREAVALAEETAAELVLTDLVMPGSSGVAALRDLRRGHARRRIVVYSALSLPSIVIDALASGADAYVLKTAPLDELMAALEHVRGGHRYLSSAVRDQLGDAIRDGAGLSALSRREREVFDLVVRGHSNLELAEWLFISVKTVETHRARINRKLGVHSTGELIRFAAVNGLVSA